MPDAPNPPHVRLAYGGPPEALAKSLAPPSVRLGCAIIGRDLTPTFGEHPTVRLAHQPAAQGSNCLMGIRGVDVLPLDSAPALLVSFVYLKGFLKQRERYVYRDWVLDSGAFSAHASGNAIDLQEYIETAKRLLAEDSTLSEVYALDVIGDWKATQKNTEAMWAAGVPAIPTFHGGQPWHALEGFAGDYPKIALGGVARRPAVQKLTWAQQCFARVWPTKIHGFGFGSGSHILALPWHSVDATNWELGPCAFGRWNAFGNLSVRGGCQDLRAEVEWYLKLERQARDKWRSTWAKWPVIQAAPAVRLAAQQGSEAQIKRSGLARGVK